MQCVYGHWVESDIDWPIGMTIYTLHAPISCFVGQGLVQKAEHKGC